MRRPQRGFIINTYRFGAAAATYSSTILADAPLGYWRLGESSGTVAADSSGNARDGTYVNAPTLAQTGLNAGDAATSVSFNGTTQYVEIAYAAWMNVTAFSVSGLVNPTASDVSLLARRQTNDATRQVFHVRGQSRTALLSNATATYEEPYGPSTLAHNYGATAHVAQTFDGSIVTSYRNGSITFKGELGVTLNQPTNTAMRIAATQSDIGGTASEFEDGKIQDVAFFGSGLTKAKIQAQATAAGVTVSDPTFNSAGTTARCQLSLRAVNGYTGALIDVRRSSDNATRTINVASGELDTADLASWGGSDSVYVSKWYDQSGNLHHFEQATNGSQPRIVNAGTLETQGGDPVINCIAGTYLREATSLLGTTDSFTIMRVTDTCGIGRGQDTFGDGWSIACGVVLSGTVDNALVLTATGAAQVSYLYTHATSFGSKCFRVVNSAGASKLHVDQSGVQRGLVSESTNSSLRTSTVGMEIGRFNGGNASGKMGECFIWRSVVDHGVINAIHDSAATRFGF